MSGQATRGPINRTVPHFSSHSCQFIDGIVQIQTVVILELVPVGAGFTTRFDVWVHSGVQLLFAVNSYSRKLIVTIHLIRFVVLV
jgi:hypothetical protein